MRKVQLVFFLSIVASINFSCWKNKVNSNNSTSSEDVVIGYYLAMNVPPNFIAGSATVSKISTGKYQLTPGSASIPSFSFNYDPFTSFFTGSNFAYLIPKQNSNSVLLDTAYLSLSTYGAKSIIFTLTSRAAGTSWRYDGVKQ